MVFSENSKQCQKHSNTHLLQRDSEGTLQKTTGHSSLTESYSEREKQSERVQRLYKDFLDNL